MKKQLEFKDRLERAIKEEVAIYKKYQIAKKPIIMFNSGKKVPFLSRVALRILSWQGGTFDYQFKDLIKK